jgi:hypothetical protein
MPHCAIMVGDLAALRRVCDGGTLAAALMMLAWSEMKRMPGEASSPRRRASSKVREKGVTSTSCRKRPAVNTLACMISADLSGALDGVDASTGVTGRQRG